MKYPIILFSICLLLISCLEENEKGKEADVFSPINPTSKWVYFHTSHWSSAGFGFETDTGFTTLEVTSIGFEKDSIIYAISIVDSVYSHKASGLQGPLPDSEEPFVNRYKISVIEDKIGNRIIRREEGSGTWDEMLEFAFQKKYYPDSLITLEKFKGESVKTVHLRHTPELVYVKNVGMVSFYIFTTVHPNSETRYSLISGP